MHAIKKILTGQLLNRQLISLLPRSGLIVVAGGIGQGKSALSYSVLEYYHLCYPRKYVYIYGFPKGKEYLLPNWVRIWEQSDDFPENSILLIDEAYIQFHSRDSMKSESKFIDKFAGLVRQKDIIGIFISQTLRKLDVGILTGCQLLLIKNIPPLQRQLDRAQTKSLLQKVSGRFQEVRGNGIDSKKCVYAISGGERDFEDLIERSNSVPTFWSEELSKPWSGEQLN